jgi:hypothetical protein
MPHNIEALRVICDTYKKWFKLQGYVTWDDFKADAVCRQFARKPCPPKQRGGKRVNHWILWAARICKEHRCSVSLSYDLIVEAMTRGPVGREVEKAIGKVFGTDASAKSQPTVKPPEFSIDALARYASRCPVDIDERWLAEVSPECVLDVTPAQFLQSIYQPGECVCVTTAWGRDADGKYLWRKKAAIWIHGDDLDSLNRFTTGEEYGVWFLSNPVNGTEINSSWRSTPNVTSWRYAVIESDKAPADLWLRALVQLDLPIAAIYTSGGRSIHALVRIDARDLEESDNILRYGTTSLLRQLPKIGADENTFTSIRLTRLPGCRREEEGQEQRLLFLSPNPRQQSILTLWQ